MPIGWYPTALAARIPWHANFAAQATASGVAQGLTAAQVTPSDSTRPPWPSS